MASKVGMRHCAASSQWLNERISLSRYSHVPLGNIELDWRIHTADIFFARALRDNNQILWVSDNGIPDLGGDNEEETCYFDEVNQLVHSWPGAYRNVTVELKIHHLAVNALVMSKKIIDMEGGTLYGFDHELTSGSHRQDERPGLDEAMSCAPAFRVLRKLIQSIIDDAAAKGNILADELLHHLYRWLCSPRSKLHDPALHRMLHKFMQKVFALLLAEFEKLGAKIIFASFRKIILDTGKPYLFAAQAYCDRLLKTLQTRDLFKWIELEPAQFWYSLLFMDPYNYGGIRNLLCHTNDDLHDDQQVEIVPSWDIAENLSKEIQIMKKNLLTFVGVREFAPEAQFKTCPFFFTLPDVICSYCNECRDLDLCQDRTLLTEEWRCGVPQCGQPYNREVMENGLLQIVRQRERLYHLQDLVCLKCNHIKAAHLAEYCGCAGSFALKEGESVFRNKMEVLLNIAVHQKFELLKECVSWILELR